MNHTEFMVGSVQAMYAAGLHTTMTREELAKEARLLADCLEQESIDARKTRLGVQPELPGYPHEWLNS